MLSPEAVVALNGPNLEPNPVSPDRLSADTMARVNTAIEWAINEDIPRIIMVGRAAIAMYDYALEHRLASSLPPIDTETQSRDTIGNAHYTKIEFLKPEDLSHIALCTADYHMFRARHVFERVLGKDYEIRTVSAKTDYSPLKKLELVTFQTIGGGLYDELFFHNIGPEDDDKREEKLLRTHPRYREN